MFLDIHSLIYLCMFLLLYIFHIYVRVHNNNNVNKARRASFNINEWTNNILLTYFLFILLFFSCRLILDKDWSKLLILVGMCVWQVWWKLLTVMRVVRIKKNCIRISLSKYILPQKLIDIRRRVNPSYLLSITTQIWI